MNSLAGCLAVLLVSSVLGYAQDEADTDTGTLPAGITCGVGDHGKTTPLRNSAGFTVVLKMRICWIATFRDEDEYVLAVWRESFHAEC